MNERGQYVRKVVEPGSGPLRFGVASLCVAVGGALLVRSWLKR